jgi:predicted GNAT family acetyltransferase
MAWTTTGDLDEFAGAAGEFLRARPVPNTLLLTTVDNLAVRGRHTYGTDDPVFGWWRGSDGAVAGVFLRTPPYPAMVTDLPDDAAVSLVELLSDMPGFSAERGVAETVADAWTLRTGRTFEVRQRIRLYRLGELVPPEPPPPGTARTAGPADRQQLVTWHDLFATELGETAGDSAAAVADRMSYGGLVLWEVDGEPVSMAGRSRAIAGMVRVAPVFTPKHLRGRGYAGAVTAAVSRAGQELADEVLLFTDLANPTSNSLYQRLGYTPIEDRLLISLRP